MFHGCVKFYCFDDVQTFIANNEETEFIQLNYIEASRFTNT